MKKKVILGITVTLLSICMLNLLLTHPSIAEASSLTMLSLDPSTIEDSSLVPGSIFHISLNVTDVANSFGWQVNMTFNPNYLNVTEIKHGPFLGTAGYPTILFPPIWNNTQGFLMISEMIFPPYSGKEGANGSGVLANVIFKVVDEGGTLLKFETPRARTKLNTIKDGKLERIPFVAVDGFFDNRPIMAIADLEPDTLNLRSEGQWVTAYIELPEGHNVGDIDIFSILLNDTISISLLDVPAPEPVPTEIGDYDEDGILDKARLVFLVGGRKTPLYTAPIGTFEAP